MTGLLGARGNSKGCQELLLLVSAICEEVNIFSDSKTYEQ